MQRATDGATIVEIENEARLKLATEAQRKQVQKEDVKRKGEKLAAKKKQKMGEGPQRLDYLFTRKITQAKMRIAKATHLLSPNCQQ